MLLNCILHLCVSQFYFTASFTSYDAFSQFILLQMSQMMQTHMVDVVRPSWISKLEPFNGMWHLSENGKSRGQFDAIVIAHNGEHCFEFFILLFFSK